MLLHANGVFWRHPAGRLWITSSLIECIFYFAVPIFFMISGATLMNYRTRYNSKEYLIKRIRRTLIPYLFWSCFAALLFLTFNKHGQIFSLDSVRGFDYSVIVSLIINIINNKFMGVYWFFLPLFVCYLSIIILSNFSKNYKILYFIAIWIFIAQFVLPFCANLFQLKINPVLTSSPMGSGFVLFVILGWILSKNQISNKYKLIFYLLGVISFFLRFTSLMLSPEFPAPINRLFSGYLNITTVFYSVAIFILVKDVSPLIENLINTISRKNIALGNMILSGLVTIRDCSLGIYLLHAYFTSKLVPFLGVNTSSIYYRIFGALLIVCVCCILTLVIKKIPFLRHTV